MGRRKEKLPERQRADFVKVTTKGIVVWPEMCYDSDYRLRRYQNFFDQERLEEVGLEKEALKEVTYSGEITVHSRRRLARVLDLILEISQVKKVKNPATGRFFKFRLAFQTLTLSSQQAEYSDRWIKENLLQPYLRIMRSRGMKNYVWKAERQGNGNIHFHIITDFFCVWSEIRDVWNNIQSRHRFISEFEIKYGHRDPNSTDVKSVRHEKEVVKYLLKYMLKESEKNEQLRMDRDYREKAKGKVWDCSQNLKIKNSEYDWLQEELYQRLEALVKDQKVKAVKDDYYLMYFLREPERSKLIDTKFLVHYNNYIELVRAG